MEAQESLPGPQLQGPSGGRRRWDPNKKMQKGVISSELPRETTADLLGICQQVPQIPTSEEDVLRKGLVTKRPTCSEWQTTQHTVAPQVLCETWPWCSALSISFSSTQLRRAFWICLLQTGRLITFTGAGKKAPIRLACCLICIWLGDCCHPCCRKGSMCQQARSPM